MKLSTREQNLLWIILVFLIGFLVYNYSYTPLTEEIESLKDKSSNLEFEIEKLHGIESLIEKTKKETVELSTKLQNDHNDIPDSWDQAELLYYTEQIIGELADKKFINLQVNDDEEIEIASGAIELNLVADYNNMKSILDSFENSIYLNDLTALSIQTTKDEEGNSSEDFEIGLTYMFFNKNRLSVFADYEFMDGKYGKPDIFK